MQFDFLCKDKNKRYCCKDNKSCFTKLSAKQQFMDSDEHYIKFIFAAFLDINLIYSQYVGCE